MIRDRVARMKWLLARRTLSRFNLDSFIRAVSFLALLGIFAAICFVGIKQLCVNLMAIDIVGPLIIKRSFAFGLMTLFVMIVLSQLVNTYSHLFQSRELTLLHQSPLASGQVFGPQAAEGLMKGCWMAAIFVLTILFAYGRGRHAPWSFYPLAVTGVVPYLLIAAGLGMLMMLLLAWLVVGRKRRERFLAVFALGGVGLFIWWGRIAAGWISGAKTAESLQEHLGEALANLRISSNLYLPSYWMSELVESAIEGREFDVILPILLLVTTAWLLLTFLWFLGGRTYRSAWLSCMERGSVKRGRSYIQRFGLRFPFTALPHWFRSLLIKEWFIFRRDFSQWGQFLLLMALVALYVVQVRDITLPDQAYRIRSIVSFFNILLLGFVQATLALRYAFPSMSLEGTAFWAVCKSPVGISRYFLGKYACHFLWILAIGEIMTLILNQVLHLGQPFSGIAMAIVAILSLGFTSCTVGLGAVYPRFDAASAADVSSSAGALVSMVLTLSYLAFSAAILARLMMNILPMEGASFLDGHGWEGVLMIAGGFGCSWIRMLLPGSAEEWLVQHVPVGGVWDILDMNSTMLLTFFLLLQVAAILYPARAGVRQLQEIAG